MSRRDQLLTLGLRDLPALVEHALALETQLAQARGQLAQNSDNSGKPPATDGLAKKPAPRSLRKKSGRKPGGQPGHPGRTLQPVAKPDSIQPHAAPQRCPCGHCGGVSLLGQSVVSHESRQVFDLPPLRLHVTEHRAEIKICPISGRKVRAAFPPGVNAPVQYGPNFQTFTAYLSNQQFLPVDRLAQLCEDLFQQPLSAGTVVRINRRLYEELAPFESCLLPLLRQADVLHGDESGLRVAGKLHWLHVACTDGLTFYGVHPKRGTEAMDALGILPHFSNFLVHDHWMPYFTYDCGHVLCNEHIRRELKFLAEEEGHRWAERLSAFLWTAHLRARRCGGFNQRQYRRAQARYHAFLRRGLRATVLSKKARNLIDRLIAYDACVLAHLIHPEVPFTNNQAEQDIRMIKICQKISGGFRTLGGALVFARIRSYLSTCRKQGHNLWEAIKQALLGHPLLPEPTAASP